MGRHPASSIPGMTYSRLAAAAAAASPLGATVNNGRFVAHKALRVKGVKVVAEAAVTGADTNSVTLALRNLGAAGAGTTDVATLALANGTDLAADTPRALTLNTTAANLLVAAGDVLTFRQVKVGNGMNIAAMHCEVEYELQ
ncbi:MAG: hypothetical protein ACYC6G_20020 [Desulfobaccales bacterium]